LNDFFKLGILYFKEEDRLRFLESVCRYVYAATKIDADAIIKTVDALPKSAREVIMTTAEKLRKEGQKEAKLEDARKMLEEGFDEKLIVKITGLSQEAVRKLKDNT